MGETTATAKKPPAPVPAVDPAAAAAAAVLEEVRKQGAAMLAETQAAAKAMLDAARAEADDVNAQARAAIAEAREQAEVIASDDPKIKAKHAVEQGRREFDRLTTGDGRIWLQHEREEDFEPISFRVIGPRWKQAEYRVLRVGRHEYTHMGRTEHSPGVAYQFNHGELEALSQDVADYLRSRPSFNILFCEAGNEPGAAPDPGVMLKLVLDAVLELDDAKLKDLMEREQASHKRKTVLDAILHGRRQIRGRTGETQGDE